MLKKLRIRFVLIIMAIVTVMLLAIVFTVVHFTRTNLEAESLRIMESIAANPMQLGDYTEEDIRAALDKVIPAKRANMKDVNFKAIRMGAEFEG